MAITFDPGKRRKTLQERGLDFAHADQVFASMIAQARDTRFYYGEDRFISAGYLASRFVVMVWTARGLDHHIISMRFGHAKEEARYRRERVG